MLSFDNVPISTETLLGKYSSIDNKGKYTTTKVNNDERVALYTSPSDIGKLCVGNQALIELKQTLFEFC